MTHHLIIVHGLFFVVCNPMQGGVKGRVHSDIPRVRIGNIGVGGGKTLCCQMGQWTIGGGGNSEALGDEARTSY